MPLEHSSQPLAINRGRAVLRHDDFGQSQNHIYTSGDVVHSSGQDNEIDILGLLKVLLKRKFLILAFVILGILGAGLFGLQQEPLYKASTSIQVQKEETQIVAGSGVEPAITADSEFMRTQYTLLKSRTLVEKVVVLLGLDSNPAFANQESNRDDRIVQASNVVIRNLRIEPVERSRIIIASYISDNPGLAARIPNAIAENYIEGTIERKFNTTAYARNFLEERIRQTKINLETIERNLVGYAEDNDILDINQGGDQSSLISSNLVRLMEEHSEVTSERIKLEQSLKGLQNGGAASQIIESPDLARIRALRSKLDDEYKELSGIYKPAFPKMQILAARIEAVDKEIEQQKQAILQASDGEFQSALTREKILKGKIDSTKNELRDLRKRRIDYTILQRELDTVRSQYDGLLQRLKEVSISSGTVSNQISVVDKALKPKLPFSPNIPMLLVLGGVIGANLGFALAFLLYFWDDTIKTPDDVKAKLKLAPIGVVPVVKIKDNVKNLILTSLNDARSGVSEAYFSATTALKYTTDNGVPKSLLLTSTQPAEGKSSSSLALGVSFAKIGLKVLIIDADMRKPSFLADIDDSRGLSGLLTTPDKVEDNIIYSEVHNLHLLPSGIIPPNPAELLSGSRLKAIISEAENLFDIVIVDSPPMLNFSDSFLLGTACEAAVIVYKCGVIRTKAAQRAVERIRDNKVNVIGAILTHFDSKNMGYDYNYYYYAYGQGASDYGKVKKSSEKNLNRKINVFLEYTDD